MDACVEQPPHAGWPEVATYLEMVDWFCARWCLQAWRARPAIIDSHFVRLRTGRDVILPVATSPMRYAPEFLIIVPVPGAAPDRVAQASQRICDAYRLDIKPSGCREIRQSPHPDQWDQLRRETAASCIAIVWDGHSRMSWTGSAVPVGTVPTAPDRPAMPAAGGSPARSRSRRSTADVSTYVEELADVRCGHPLSYRERRAVRGNADHEVRSVHAYLSRRGWRPDALADLELHASWVVRRLQGASFAAIATEWQGQGHAVERNTVSKAVNAFAGAASLTLPRRSRRQLTATR
jgi:hypothetical protein